MRQPAALLDHRLVRPRQHPAERARTDGEKAEKQLAEIARRSNAFAQAKSGATKRFIFSPPIETAFYTSLHEGLHHAPSRRACADGKGVGVRIQPRGDSENSPSRSLAAAAARRSEQPRLRPARSD